METRIDTPKTLQEAAKHYADPTVCEDLLIELRWPNGTCCPHCGCVDAPELKQGSLKPGARLWYCNGCKQKFSVKVGTIFEDSPLKLDKWFLAFWLITSAKNGISSCEIHRAIGVTQKTAWFMLHRIRHAMQTGSFEKMSGTVEADEVYVGGKEKNKHADKKQNAGRGTVGKAIVAAVLERSEEEGKSSRVKTRQLRNTSRESLHGMVRNHVQSGSAVYTDAHISYRGLAPEFIHEFVDHAVRYAQGAVHTNGLENFFSLLRRTINGTYVAVEPFHLAKYMDEQAYRFNTRKMMDAERFIHALASVGGRRLTYEELTTSHVDYFDQFGVE